MKALVETTDNFSLVDLTSGQVVNSFRPGVVTMTPFFNSRLGLGQVRIIHNEIADDATDEIFADIWDEMREDPKVETGVASKSAIDAFIAEFAVQRDPIKTTEAKPDDKGGSKKVAK